MLKVRKAGSSTVETVALERFESNESKQEDKQETQQVHDNHIAAPISSAGRHHKGSLSESAAMQSRGLDTTTALSAAHHEYRPGPEPSRGQGGGLDAARDKAPESILRRAGEQHHAQLYGGAFQPGNEVEQYPAVRHDPSLHPDSPSGSYRSDEDGGWGMAARDLGQGMQAGQRADPSWKQVVQSYESAQLIPPGGISGRVPALHGATTSDGASCKLSISSGLQRETAGAVHYERKQSNNHDSVLPDGSGSSALNARYNPLDLVRPAVPYGELHVRDSEGSMQPVLPSSAKAIGLSAGSNPPSQGKVQVHHRRLSPPPPPPVAGGAEATQYDVQGTGGGWRGGAGGGAYEDGDLDERCSLPRDPSLDRILAPQSASTAAHKGKTSEKLFGLGVTFKVIHSKY